MISKQVRYFYSQTNLELLLNKFAKTRTPYFKVQSNQIEIIKDPMDFYFNLYVLFDFDFRDLHHHVQEELGYHLYI
jgi:hypothetical protein